ncbi:lantibiotic dehydratase [Pedobacter deserti]|uniref:lantibiotic dehydratase n=1 Tax=Pedobacter deserti TaxID=2817382 RepID=UPI00210DB4B0|nr:lantibiotic dehydratase [Pedobacter sp. SYSU D00382]
MNPKNYHFDPTLLIRTPAKPLSEFSLGHLGRQLLDKEFQQALHLASPDLFTALRKLNFRFEKLTPKLGLAVYRYYNRMSFRSTPFGAFASVGVTKWSDRPTSLCRLGPAEVFSFPDFARKYNRGAFNPGHMIYANPTLYVVGDHFRFLFRRERDGERTSFRIVSIFKSRPLERLLNIAQAPVHREKLIEFLTEDLQQKDSSLLVDQLLNAQVLLFDQGFRVTGEFRKQRLPETGISQTYAIAFHQQQGSLNSKYQKDIYDAIHALKCMIPLPEDPMDDFKKKFYQKFELAEVPLMKALDPQLGVDYLQAGRALDQHYARAGADSGSKFGGDHWSSLSSTILQRMMTSAQRQQVVALNEEDLAAFPDKDGSLTDPPSISVMFRITADQQLLLEYAGGSSAINLAGRFSHHSGIRSALKQITSIEQSTNSEVIFAEIVFAGSRSTDAINSRGHLRDYEIPVLSASSLPEDQVIHLNDLFVRLVGDRLVLRSKRLNRTVIPRLASAYNYRLSNLSIFRFLADLQHQGLRSYLHFDPEHVVPGLSFYPRIVFNNVILSPAKWILNDRLLGTFTDTENGRAEFRKIAQNNGMSKLFAMNSGDQFLVFDLGCDLSLSYFFRLIGGQRKIVLQEYFEPNDQDGVRSPDDQQYASQFLAFLINKEPVYKKGDSTRPQTLDFKGYLPGEDWLYYKLYGHPKTIYMLLADPGFQEMLERLSVNKQISTWFFIWYADPQDHLRIRFKCLEKHLSHVHNCVTRWIRQYLESGLLSDFLIGTYRPEVHRYGFAGMGQVESVFCRSSRLVLNVIKRKFQIAELYASAVSSVLMICSAFLPDAQRLLGFVRNALLNINFTKTERIDLDRYYRDHKSEFIEIPRKIGAIHGMQELSDSCTAIAAKAAVRQQPQYDTLILDLIHMHVNRLSVVIGEDIEKKVYYWLLKYCLTKLHSQKSSMLE